MKPFPLSWLKWLWFLLFKNISTFTYSVLSTLWFAKKSYLTSLRILFVLFLILFSAPVWKHKQVGVYKTTTVFIPKTIITVFHAQHRFLAKLILWNKHNTIRMKLFALHNIWWHNACDSSYHPHTQRTEDRVNARTCREQQTTLPSRIDKCLHTAQEFSQLHNVEQVGGCKYLMILYFTTHHSTEV